MARAIKSGLPQFGHVCVACGWAKAMGSAPVTPVLAMKGQCRPQRVEQLVEIDRKRVLIRTRKTALGGITVLL
jgi:hypothetical protein